MNSNWSYSLEMPNLGQNHQFHVQCDLKIWRMTLKNKRTSLPCYLVNSNWSYSLVTPNSGQNQQVFVPCDLEIWQMTLKNNKAPLLCYFKLSASLHSHWPIRAGVTVWKRPIWIKFDNFFASCDLEKNHFIVMGELRFEWQSGNAKIGSNLTTFCHLWPWNLRMTFKNNRAPFLDPYKLYATNQSHWWI